MCFVLRCMCFTHNPLSLYVCNVCCVCVCMCVRVCVCVCVCVYSEVEVGRDMFYCCVCACPPRDIVKAQMKLEGQTVSRSRKRKRSM